MPLKHFFSLSMFSGFKRSCNTSAGILAKASSFGAKTVNGPGSVSIFTNFAAVTALTSIDKFEFETAASMMFGNLTAENQNLYYLQIMSIINIEKFARF